MVKFGGVLYSFQGMLQDCAEATACGCTCMIKRHMWVGAIKRNERAFLPFLTRQKWS